MGRKLLTIQCLTLLFLCTSLAVNATAAVSPSQKLVVESYVKAVKESNRPLVDKTAASIDRSSTMQAYMQENYPHIYSVYKWRSIVKRLYDLRERYKNLGEVTPPTGIAGRPTKGREVITNDRFRSNSQNRYTNRDRVSRVNNQDRLRRQSNRPINRTALRTANQNRRPNSTRTVRRRTR